MKLMPLVLGLMLGAASPAFASAHSDYTKSFPLRTLKTFEFKDQHRISRDPLANNDIWANDVRSAIRDDLTSHGMVEVTDGHPDFQVAFYVGLRERYDIDTVGYGFPFHRGFRSGWWGWPRGYDAWAVPYTESTLIVDMIDTHTNQLVWRGYDTDTLSTGKADKTLTKAVDNVMSRFYHDVKETPRHAG
jgi:uncharacterized protein DUF4136